MRERDIKATAPRRSRKRVGSVSPVSIEHDETPVEAVKFGQPEQFINRELSWIEFNRRVLEEAQDPSQPLLERLKFLAIVGSNLDEFFEIRVSGIKQLLTHNTPYGGPDGLTTQEIFEKVNKACHAMVQEQNRLWRDEIQPLLAKEKIRFLPWSKLSRVDQKWAETYFLEEVFPVLTPLAVDASHPFPQLLNKSLNMIVAMHRPSEEEISHGLVQLPRVLPRLVPLPRAEDAARRDYLLLDDLVRQFAGSLFPGVKVTGAFVFRVTRNSDLYIDEEEVENLLRKIESELRKRHRGAAVRLEIEEACPKEIVGWLLQCLRLGPRDIYKIDGPIWLGAFLPLCSDESLARLKDRPFTPSFDLSMPSGCDPFEVLRTQDVLLHHPYESFDSVIELLETAADDPQVMGIKMTLYRTSGDSPIVKALIQAARQGKQVTVMVELKARFDEENNIQWARRMEDAGVHVVYGLVGLKTHCKATLITRRDGKKIRHYAHLGTGNYHPKTARLYTDLSILTANPDLCNEVAVFFNTLTGLSEHAGSKHLIVAPFEMAPRFLELIERETALGSEGRIIVKVNSLVSEEIITALYEASCAGVRIDLIVRGICCLRPGIPGLSEHIRVTSIVGRFLEHSRIYYFGNGGEPHIYLGSADWMPRNFYRRVELAFPILDPHLRKHLTEDILPAYLHDNVKARLLQPDGSYQRIRPEPGQKAVAAQLTFREISRRESAAQARTQRTTIQRLTPRTLPKTI